MKGRVAMMMGDESIIVGFVYSCGVGPLGGGENSRKGKKITKQIRTIYDGGN